ncbi:MAG: hypothetical protein KC620_22450, partial [Myxococcales bacterium]|nr:hypothetical protein [Myxococcales bacterium]
MSWLSIGLLAGTYALGARAGAGVVADEVTMLMTPWAGARWGDAAVAIQAPLRVSFAEGRLRDRDWDEGADFGRLLRFARYGDFVRVGQVVDLTLGQGTLVRRYHNGVDDDHHRLGALVAGTIGPLGVEIFADQVFAAPVGGARAQWTFDAPFTVGATFAGDFAAPVTLSGGVDDTGRPRGRRDFFGGGGLDVAWHLLDDPDGRLDLYGVGQVLDSARFGAHLGFAGTARPGPDWRLEGRLEGIAL